MNKNENEKEQELELASVDSEENTNEEISEGENDAEKEQDTENIKKPGSEKDGSSSSDEKVSSNKTKIIVELALAAVAIIAIVIAIAIKQKQENSDPTASTADQQIAGTETTPVNIDNSVLYENIPAITPLVQNEDLDYASLESEGKMLKLTGTNGEEIYVHNYSNEKYFNDETPFDNSEVDAEIRKNVLVSFLEPEEVSRDTAEMYDTVSINYVGTMDGVAFDGGTANDQQLTIGISAYIDGFTEGIVGMKVGETKDVHVTFPEDYSSTDLAGKPAVFSITLNQIINANKIPELTDEIANTYTGGQLTTAAELRDYFKKNLLSVKIWDFIDTDFHVSSVSDEDILSYYNKLMESIDKSSQQYQMSAESIINMYYGQDIEAYKQEMMVEAVESMRHAALYNAIAAKENISVSEEDILKLAGDYGYTSENIDEFKEMYGEDIIHDYILQSNLMDYFITLHK
ncbi:MAG: FKBP-type peptidyl-prolyl cis-trans isomerase [Lachnospiraceae bacterium]|nr:FKBP-type peptidyl-prolyl cis-trans isomerase [Lachnospiraceae bacterium]